jgi:hypothetical protein
VEDWRNVEDDRVDFLRSPTERDGLTDVREPSTASAFPVAGGPSDAERPGVPAVTMLPGR